MTRLVQHTLLLFAANWMLVACAGTAIPNPTIQPGEVGFPTPASLLMKSFISQTDGLFGYRMLRPDNWNSANLVDMRGYMTPGFDAATDRIIVRAVNLQARYKSSGDSTGINATLALFEKDPSLSGWTDGVEQNWRSLGLEYTLLSNLSQAKIYSVKSPGSVDVQIVAYVVDKGQPLAIDLTASGAYADLNRLRQEGVLDDFVVIVGSAQAISPDPQNVQPPLSR